MGGFAIGSSINQPSEVNERDLRSLFVTI